VLTLTLTLTVTLTLLTLSDPQSLTLNPNLARLENLSGGLYIALI